MTEQAETPNELTKALATVAADVAQFDRYAEGIDAIAKEHPVDLVIPEIGTVKGMAAAVAGRAAWRNPRIELGKARKAAKAPVLALGREIDARAAEIEDRLRIGESNYDAQIKAEEDRKEAIRLERERAEADRVRTIQAEIATITEIPLKAIGASAAELGTTIEQLVGRDLSHFDEVFYPSAQQARDTSLDQLRAMLDQRVTAEQQAKAQRVESERLAAERQQLEAEDAERRERIAREDQKRADRQAEEDRQRAAQAEADRVERQRVQDEQNARQAELDRQEQEAIAERERVEREAEEARQATAQREREAQEAAAQEVRDREAAARREAEEQAIQTASLYEAAAEGLALLIQLGQSEHIACKKLRAAINREPQS